VADQEISAAFHFINENSHREDKHAKQILIVLQESYNQMMLV
jgi:hypothetical protein